MRKTRRNLLFSTLSGTAVIAALPKQWSRPVVETVILPAHAETSFMCSGFDVEPVDQPIDITVTATQINGPIIADLDASGSFDTTQTIASGSCSDDSEFSQQTMFSGIIDSSANQISGDLIIRQFCGPNLFCEQISVYTATQISPDPNSDLGDYQGRITGTQTCCQDFL